MDEIKKEFIPYEQALELKQLGFDEPCFGSYVKLTETQNTFFMNDVVLEIDRETPLHESLITKVPTFSQAFRWFRNKGFISQIKYNSFEGYYCFEIDWEGHYEDEGWDEFEYAELTCLIKLIEIIKNGK